MHKGIATVSISGLLSEKLEAIAAAGFDGIELFDNDLISSPLSPTEIRTRCADLGLSIDLFQPVRDVEGVPPDRFDAVLHRLRIKLEVMAELGTTRSWPAPPSRGTPSTTRASGRSSCTAWAGSPVTTA